MAEDVLRQQARLEFRASGSSMFPTIRNGDIVTIQRAPAEQVRPGAIVLYRDICGRAVLHRVVGLYKQHTTPIFVVRGDAQTHVEQVTSGQIMGVAVAIRRGSVERPLGTGLHDLALLRVVRTRSRLLLGIRWLAAKALDVLQSLPLYRGVVKRLISSHIRYAMADKEGRADQIAAANRLQAEGQSAVHVQFITTVFWNITIGSVTLVKYPDNDRVIPHWWIHDLRVRRPFRRSGIGQHLTDMALIQAKEQGADAVHLYVFSDNHPAMHLYERHGFAQIEPIWLASTQDVQHHHRITMRYSFTPH